MSSTRSSFLSRSTLLLPAATALVMLALSIVGPGLDETPMLARPVQAAACLLLVGLAIAVRRARRLGESLTIERAMKPAAYPAAVALVGMYVNWSLAWPPAAKWWALTAVQILFAYGVGALLAFWRRKPWVIRFDGLFIGVTINFFWWFTHDYFTLQLALVALAVVAGELIRRRRGDAVCRVFNPAALALFVASLGVVATRKPEVTRGLEIAQSLDRLPHAYEILFLLGVVLQLASPIALITMSAATVMGALAAVYAASAGTYVFTTAAIPVGIFFGMIVLVADAETTPETRIGRVLFGAAYGAITLASIVLLERLGPYGYCAGLLVLPLLNLLVPAFDAAARRVVAAWSRRWHRSPEAETPGRDGGVLVVAAWAAVFVLLRSVSVLAHAPAAQTIAFWQHACGAGKRGACDRLFVVSDDLCESGEQAGCHAHARVLLEARIVGRRGTAWDYFRPACDAGFIPSCTQLGDHHRLGKTAPVDPARWAYYYTKSCDGDDLVACGLLAKGYEGDVGLATDAAASKRLHEKACKGNVESSCVALVRLELAKGSLPPEEVARAAEVLTSACNGGDSLSCSDVGLMHLYGDGVPRDSERALSLQVGACDDNLALGCARLSTILWQQAEGPSDRDRARDLRRKACKLGYQAACQPLPEE